MKLESHRKFSTNKEISNFIKICPLGAQLFHTEDEWTDGQTDMTTLTVAFCNFANMPKNSRKNTHTKNTPTLIWVIMGGQLKQTVNSSLSQFNDVSWIRVSRNLVNLPFTYTHIRTQIIHNKTAHTHRKSTLFMRTAYGTYCQQNHISYRNISLWKCTNKIFMTVSTYIVSPVI
jgi:hypothetical protein